MDLKRNREEVPNQISKKALRWAGPTACLIFRPDKLRRLYFSNFVREDLTLSSTFSCVSPEIDMNDVTLLCIVTAYVGVLKSLWLFLFATQPKEFFLDGLKKLEQRSHKCVELRGGNM
jgi:hypothetical protein